MANGTFAVSSPMYPARHGGRAPWTKSSSVVVFDNSRRWEPSWREGGKADIAKPLRGMGTGVFEIALAFRGDAFRVVYCVQLGEDIWVVHAFQKKSTKGIKTPLREIDLVRERMKALREMLG